MGGELVGLREAIPKTLALKGWPAEKMLSVRGVTQKIALECCNDSIYDSANFSTKMP